MDIPITRAFPGSVRAGSQKRRAAQGADERFEKNLEAAARKSGEEHAEAAVPQGWTRENLNTLRERYSGKMSLNELHEALIDMESMGVISDREAKHAMGCALLSVDRNHVRTDGGTGLFTLDDVFAWVAVARNAGQRDYLPYTEPISWGRSGFSVSV